MDPIYRELATRLERGEELALATLIETKGSTPQKCGAKAIFLRDGRILGTLGGGCLEAETRQKALRALDTNQPLSFRLVLDDDFGWDDGLICGGAVRAFIEPNPRSREIWRWLLNDLRPREHKMLAVIVAAEDPAHVGQRALYGDGQWLVADDIPPNQLRQLANICAAELPECEPEPRLEQLSATVTAYLEPVLPRPILLVCGGGHVGAAIGRLAAWSGFAVVAIDDRAEFANKERFPDAATIIVDDPARVVKEYPVDAATYVVIVTRGHRHDAQILQELIHRPTAYLGMIGSRRKLRTIMEGFLAAGVATAEDFRRVHSPMGLAIGSVTVEEIAVSVVAQLIALRRGANSAPSLSLAAELADQLAR